MRTFNKTLLQTALFSMLAASPFALADNLKEIYQLALQNDPQLRAAEAQFNANQETRIQARSALLPQIGFNYSINDTSAKTNLGDSDTDSNGYTLRLEQTLFNLSSWYSFKAGKSLSEQAAAQFAADQQSLMVRTAEAYFNVLRAKDVLASSSAEEKAIARQLEQTQQRFDVGLIAITDVHEATAAYDLALVKRLSDEGQLGIAYEALSVLTGQAHNNLSLLKVNFPTSKPEQNREHWVDLALANNNALKVAQLGSESALQKARASKAGHMPTVTASLSRSDYSFDGDLAPTSPEDQEQTQISVSLDIPLFSGGAVSSKRRQAYQQYYQSQEGFTAATRNTIQAIRSLHLTVSTDAARVAAQNKSITSAQSALDATEAGYQVGTRNVVDVLNAQRNLYASRRDYANARYDYVIDSLKLKEQAGTLNPQDIYDLNDWLEASK
jgi:outer membrane protein